MGQFNFYATESDVVAIFGRLSDRGDLAFVPDRSYPSDQHIVLSEVRTTEQRALSQNRRWYVTGSYTKEPLYMRRIKENYFSIWLDYDGPAISLTVPPLGRCRNETVELVPGYLFHPRAYWDHEITEARKVPQELKEAYASVVKTIKECLIRRRIDIPLWIGKDAFSKLQDGTAIILSRGKWWDGKGNFIRSNLNRLAK